jgi:hypothetical protein
MVQVFSTRIVCRGARVRGRVEVRSEQLDKDTPLASRTMAALPLLPLE